MNELRIKFTLQEERLNEHRDDIFNNKQNFKEVLMTVGHHDKKLEDISKTQIQLINEKMDLKKFESYEVLVGEQIDDFKKRNDNNTNHFAMVENFIEKYLPL